MLVLSVLYRCGRGRELGRGEGKESKGNGLAEEWWMDGRRGRRVIKKQNESGGGG